MAKRKETGVSPITNRIYYGTQDTEKHMWIGQKTDITDSAIASVFEWFMANMEGKEEYSIGYSSYDLKSVLSDIDIYFEIVENNRKERIEKNESSNS